MAREFQ